MKDINAIDLEKDYVDKDKAMLMLGVESHNFYKVASEFGVKIITQGKVKHFCLEDLLNSKNEVDKFIDKHYACKYVEQNMLSARKCERYGSCRSSKRTFQAESRGCGRKSKKWLFYNSL